MIVERSRPGKTSCRSCLRSAAIHAIKVVIPTAIDHSTALAEPRSQYKPNTTAGKKHTAYKLPEKMVISTISPGGLSASNAASTEKPMTEARVHNSSREGPPKGATIFL